MPGLIPFLKSIFGICETQPLHPNLWSIEGNQVRVKLHQMPEFKNHSGAYYIKGDGLPKPILLIKDENNKFFAYENRCTHFGRKIDPVFGEHKLRCCSVNHSTFDMDGHKTSGPAKGDLKTYPIQQSNGDLLITL